MTISLPHSLSLRRLRSRNQKANRQITIDRYTPSRTRKIRKQIDKPRKCRQTSATEIPNLLCSRISAGINSVTQNVSSVRNPAPPSLLRQKTSTETADIHRRPDLCNHRRRTPLTTRSPARKWLTRDFVFRRWDLSPSKCHLHTLLSSTSVCENTPSSVNGGAGREGEKGRSCHFCENPLDISSFLHFSSIIEKKVLNAKNLNF